MKYSLQTHKRVSTKKQNESVLPQLKQCKEYLIKIYFSGFSLQSDGFAYFRKGLSVIASQKSPSSLTESHYTFSIDFRHLLDLKWLDTNACSDRPGFPET